jgi:hypothetical protein
MSNQALLTKERRDRPGSGWAEDGATKAESLEQVEEWGGRRLPGSVDEAHRTYEMRWARLIRTRNMFIWTRRAYIVYIN